LKNSLTSRIVTSRTTRACSFSRHGIVAFDAVRRRLFEEQFRWELMTSKRIVPINNDLVIALRPSPDVKPAELPKMC
jgi:hypothetical protein